MSDSLDVKHITVLQRIRVYFLSGNVMCLLFVQD